MLQRAALWKQKPDKVHLHNTTSDNIGIGVHVILAEVTYLHGPTMGEVDTSTNVVKVVPKPLV